MQLLSSLSLNYAPCVYNTQNEEQENDQWLDNASGFWPLGILFDNGDVPWSTYLGRHGMASQWVLFHAVATIFFIFILLLLCMPVQMTAQKISDKIKDCRT